MWIPEERPCPVCSSTDRRVLGKRGGNAHHKGSGVETSIVQCQVCELLYAFPTLVPKSSPYELETAEEYFGLHDFEAKVQYGRSLADFACALMGSKGSMLELGCGRGEFLIGAKERGWEVKGVEMTNNYAEAARSHEIDVEVSSIEDCEAIKKQWDVIVLVAVLEHVYDPLGTLRLIHQALRGGGLLFIDVPNEFSLAMRLGNGYMRLLGKDWVVNLSPTFPPYHVMGFSPASLRNILKRAGFQIHTMLKPKRNDLIPKGRSLKRKLELSSLRFITLVGRAIGLGDGLECWAMKPRKRPESGEEH